MSTEYAKFMNKSNQDILWDVLLEQFNVSKNNITIINNFKLIFDKNVRLFLSKQTNNNLKIVELNKLFLSQLVSAVNQLYPNLNKIKRITITDEEIIEPYKVEDIHASRQTLFEKELELKKMELENLLIPQRPQEVDFSDKINDEKITSMNLLIEEKIIQRQNEIQNITNTEKQPKKVTWDIDESPKLSIFDKLKKTTEPVSDSTYDYDEQKSLSLSDFKNKPENITNTSKPILQNKPLLTLSELTKLFNNIEEINDKLENISLMIKEINIKLDKIDTTN